MVTQLVKQLDSTNRKLNFLIEMSVTIPQTAVWYFGYYSTHAYLFMMGYLFLLVFFRAKRKTNPQLGQTLQCIGYGVFPALSAVIMPEYPILSICFHFICFQSCSTEVELSKVPYLLLSNTVAWICYYFYCSYTISNWLERNPQASFFNRDSGVLAQFFVGFILNVFHVGADLKTKIYQKRIREEYEQRLVSLNKELAETNNKLKLTNQELKFALEEKENFILRFSHEIRNPLNSLLGNIDLCNEIAEDPESLKMLKDAKISGEILLQLLNNVLDTAKVSAGRLEISPLPHNIYKFLKRSWVVCSEIIRKRGLYGCLTVSRSVPDVLEFDHHRLMQILMNMTSNGAKFTEHGYVKIYVDFCSGKNKIESDDMQPKYSRMHGTSRKSEEYNESIESLDSEELVDDPVFDTEHLTDIRRSITAKSDPSMKNPEKVVDSANQPKLRSQSKRKIFFDQTDRDPGLTSGFIRIEIIDSGCGLKKSDLENLFSKFSQVNEESSKRQIGTGLGLWITKELVELMDGKIQIFSKFKIGTVIVIMLKSKLADEFSAPSASFFPTLEKEGKGIFLKTSSSPQKIKTYSSSSLEDEDQSLPKPNNLTSIKRALVVEDSPYNQEINKRFLQKCSVKEISIANNGKEAVDAIFSREAGYFEFVLMDIDMPIMDGKQAVKLIREEENKKGWLPLTIVFLTAYSEAKTQKELLDPNGQYRANGFIAKPASMEMMQQTINDLHSKAVRKASIESSIPLKSPLKQDSRNQKNLILVVDDDDSFNLNMMTKMITVCGFRALQARNGLAAFELYSENWKDIKFVLMDCEMPVMDGWEATKKIMDKYKSVATMSQRELMIYGLTGHVGKEYREKCLEAGMKDVLEKPITTDRLRKLLHDAAESKS